MAKRLIFYGGTREINNDGTERPAGKAHNWAFYHAGKNVQKDYKNFAATGEFIKIDCADTIVKKIGAQKESSIQSLDILSHGTPYTLNFSVEDDRNCGFATSTMIKLGVNIGGYFSDQLNAFGARSQLFSDIDYSRFASNARVQFHGCSIAGEDGFSVVADNIAEVVSKLLHSAGKTGSYVIGHVTKSNPNIKGKATKNSEQDYRHGTRVVYRNGEVIFRTKKAGFLKEEDIMAGAR